MGGDIPMLYTKHKTLKNKKNIKNRKNKNCDKKP